MIRTALAACLLAVTPLRANSAPLALSDCLRLAAERSVQAVQAALEERQSKAAQDQAKSARLPQLFASGQLLRSDDGSRNLPGDNNATIAVEQRLLPISSAWIRAEQQNELYQAAALAKLESDQDVALAVKRLYFAILEDQDATRSSDEVETELRRLLETVVPKFTVGRAPAFDPIKVRAGLSDLARARRVIEARLAEEKQTLSLVVGLKTAGELELVDVAGRPELPGAELRELALRSNPGLRTQNRRIEGARLGVKAARALRYPDVVGRLDYGYSAQTTSQMASGWTASLALRVPVYDWGGITSQIAQEKISVLSAENQLEAQRQSVLISLSRSLAQAQAHRKDLDALQELLPRVKEVAVEGVTRYRRGANGILEATDGVNLWLNNLLAERAAYYDYLTDLAELERLCGGEYKASYER